MVGDSVEITLIELNKITPNDYNPNIVPEEVLAKLRAEISQKGLCVPITVRSSGNGYQIVDGEHRWRVCKELGWQEIPCIIADFDDTEAKIKTLQLNYMKGSAVPVKLAFLIHDLSKEISLVDLAKRLPYEEPQMLNDLELLKLPEEFGKAIEDQARKEEQELPTIISFVVYKKQLEPIQEAIRIALESLPREAKNLKAMALEEICMDFVERQRVNNQEG